MLNARHPTYNSPRVNPLAQPPLLYLFQVFRNISLAFECYHAALNTPDHIGGPTLGEDTAVDVDRLGIWQRVEVVEDWFNYPAIL